MYYDSTTNPVTQAEIKSHVDAYKAAVEGRMGEEKTIQEARLMTGTAEGSWDNEWTTWTHTSGSVDNDMIDIDDYCGFRPVLVVLKSNI